MSVARLGPGFFQTSAQTSRPGLHADRWSFPPGRPRRGFTLVELLVVVALLALLLGILLPSLHRARQTTRALNCVNNLGTITKAGLSFVNDHKGYIPRDYWYDPVIEPTGPRLVPEALSSYLAGPARLIPRDKDPLTSRRDPMLAAVFKDMEVLQCMDMLPAPHRPFTVRHPLDNRLVTISEHTYDYVVNPLYPDGHGHQQHTLLNSLPPAMVYMTGANRNLPIDFLGYNDLVSLGTLWWNDYPRMMNDNRHFGHLPLSFLDGSAELRRYEQATVVIFAPRLTNPDRYDFHSR